MSPEPSTPTSPSPIPTRDTSAHVQPKNYVTADIPPIGGTLKQRPEDFLVDEQPQYAPSGEGEHVYMLVQKRSLSTFEMVDVIAKHFGVRTRDVGYAGLKDKHAITRQVVSVYTPGKKPEDFPMLQHDKVQVLWTDLHNNKLRPGHLRGNRFSIKIRNVRPTDVLTANRVLTRLQRLGVPNRVGEQRFGMIENNHRIGRALIMGEYEAASNELLGPSEKYPDFNAEARALYVHGKHRAAINAYPRGARTESKLLYELEKHGDHKRAWLAADETVFRFYLSAFQSAVFNAVLDERIAAQTLGSLSLGDAAFKHGNGAIFAVDETVMSDPTTNDRLKTFEISPSGPMWASSMLRAQGPTDAAEVAALARFDVTPEDLAAYDARSEFKLEGKRRPLRVPLIDPEVEGGVDEFGAYVRCAFELPRGSFATVALREVMKPIARPEGWEDAE